MRVLLDQNLPRALRNLLPGHDVRHASEMGWAELANGDLLDVAETAGFEAMLTADQSLRYQQSLASRRLKIVVLSTNHWPTLQAGGALLDDALQASGRVLEVALPRPRRKRRSPEPGREP